MSSAAQFTSTSNKGTPGTITAANTATNGTGATGRILIFTAAATGFSLLPTVRIKPLGTGVATIIRLFRNNGVDPEAPGNNTLIWEEAIAASTLSQTAKMPEYDVNLGLRLTGHATLPERIYATLGTAHAAGVQVMPLNGGDS